MRTIIEEDLQYERTLSEVVSAVLLTASEDIFIGLKNTNGNFYPKILARVYLNNSIKHIKAKIPLDSSVLNIMKNVGFPINFVNKDKVSKDVINRGAKGTYVRTEFGGTNIFIYLDVDSIQNLNKKFEEGYVKTFKDVYFSLYYMAHNSLLHELKHVFDDYRTSGKIYQTKQARKFFQDQRNNIHKKIYQAAQNSAEDKIKDELANLEEEYINLPHEIWARYSQALDRVRFVKLDIDDAPDGGIITNETMVELPEFIKNFKSRLEYFNLIEPHHKRRMLKAAVKAWHEAKDFLDKYGTYLNPNNMNLSDPDYLLKKQAQLKESEGNNNNEIFNKVKDILLNSNGILMPDEISALADKFGVSHDEMISITRQVKLSIESEKYNESSEDIKDFVEEISKSGVNTKRASIDAMLAMFNELHNNHHTEDLGVSEDTLKELLRFHSRGGKMVAESIRTFIRKSIQETFRK